jgi:cell wall-associated NlpC family hydrolase
MTTTHWAETYIGEPWVAGEHDCWAFARRVWRERFGVEVPAVDVDACNRMACVKAFAGAEPERANWLPVMLPEEGDAVLIGKSERPSHVGVWVDADCGGVLHCVQGAGVVFNSTTSLYIGGWRILGFYRRAG